MDEQTGELLDADGRLLKWQLQAVARVALGVFDPGQRYEDGHRIRVCHRHERPDPHSSTGTVGHVEVRQGEGRPYYAGLMACGSVWVCPVCAAKIQAVRSLEVRAAIDAAAERGWDAVMVTQTIRHQRTDQLADLLDGFTLALRKYKGQRGYTKAAAALGIRGSIRGLEVTHGANGWHVHAHTILLLERGASSSWRVRSTLFPLWESAVARAGLGSLDRRAFDVQDASAVRSYVTKLGAEYQWNSEHELVRSHSKQGRRSMTPFDLLRANLEQSRPDLAALFREYADCFHGRRQLVWSNGLKAELGVADRNDQTIADGIGQLDAILARIPLEAWRTIRARNWQGHVLRIAEDHGPDGIRHLLEALEGASDERTQDRVAEKRAGEDRPRAAVDAGTRTAPPVAVRPGGVGPGRLVDVDERRRGALPDLHPSPGVVRPHRRLDPDGG